MTTQLSSCIQTLIIYTVVSCCLMAVFSVLSIVMKKFFFGCVALMSSMMAVSFAQEYATLEDFLTVYIDHFDDDIPDSYQYIRLYYKNVDPDSELYPVLQKAIYLDMIANKPITMVGGLLITENSLAQVKRFHRGQEVEGSDDYVTMQELQEFVDALPSYRAYYCSLTSEIPTYTIDVSDFALTKAENFAIMDDVYRKLTTQYLYREKFSDADLIAGAIKGMVGTADDDYTTYFSPVEAEQFQTSLSNTYVGVGIVIEATDAGLQVVSPMQGSPAKAAGIQPDDIITHVDGKDITTMGAEAAGLIIGPAGTDVTLTIVRNQIPQDITITREIIVVKMVEDRELDNGDYYIALTSFGFGAASEMRSAIQRYKDSGATSLIVDLRHNPGGSVKELEYIIDSFLPSGTPAFHMNGEGFDYNYITKNTDIRLPSSSEIVVMIDGGSASAAEMLALILQDHQRATIVGEQSFGKGTAQSVTDYSDGSSFKYTIYERFSTKSDTSINTTGVRPDTIVEFNKDRYKTDGFDNQLEYVKGL